MSHGGRARSSPGLSGKGDDFYSQIASLAGDLDSSETEASGGELNSNSPPKVDVDNLEANLFSSLGKKKATTRGRRDSGETSSSPGKSVTKETPAGKKSKGFDMGELSKLLGTEDIMKDLSSAKEKPSGVSSLSGGGVKPLRPSDARIKEDADDLLDILASADFDFSDTEPVKSKATPSTRSNKTNEAAGPNIGKPITSAASSVASTQRKTDAGQKLEEEAANKVDPPKPPGRANKPLKTAAVVSFDSDDDGDDLLAGLGLDDGNGGKKGNQVSGAAGKVERGPADQMLMSEAGGDGKGFHTRSGSNVVSKKSVRFSEDTTTSSPTSLQEVSLAQNQPGREVDGAEKVVEQEKLELPKFPWQKKAQQPSSSELKHAEESHAKVDQAGAEKLEAPKFPWQKKTQQEPPKKSSPEESMLSLGDPFGNSRRRSEAPPKSEGQKLSSPEDLLRLDDPFAKATQKAQSQPEVRKQASPSPESLLELDDPFAKKNRRPTRSQTEVHKQSPERVLELSDPFAKMSHKPAQSLAEPPKELPASSLDLGDPFAKTNHKPARSHPEVQNQPPESLLQFDDPFAKTNRRPSRPQAERQRQSSPALSSSKLPAEIDASSAALMSVSPHLGNSGPSATDRSTNGSLTGTRGNSNGAGVRQEDLLRALKRAEEAEAELERERSEHAQCKRLLMDAENKLHLAMSELEKWKMEAQAYKSNMSETEATSQNNQDELRAKLKENTLILQKVEMDYSHAQQLLESSKKRHDEEMEIMKQSHNLRVKNLEESLSRMENRWKDELKVEVSRWQDKLELAEKEKFDAVQSLQRKVDSLEVAKNNDMDRIKSVYMSTMENLKNEHEADKQQLVRRNMDEVKVLKEAHSHTRTLTELNSKVEASSQVVSQLQAKLAEEHDKVLEEKVQMNRIQESQLKVMEERLIQQQVENEAERSRLQGLMAKMEAHISQQNRTLEQDRWTLQQDQARLKAQQVAFREEQIQGRKRLEEDREQFQQAREQFLVEQQNILAKCYKEQTKITMEKAETSFRRKKAEDYEISSRHMSQQAVADRNLSLSHLNEELVQMEVEKRKLTKLEDDLKVERRLLNGEKERLQKFADEVCNRSKEVDTMCKDAMEMQRKGERELKEAQELKRECLNQQESLQMELSHLRKKEIQISAEQLELIEHRKHFQQLMQRTSIGIGGKVHQFEASNNPGDQGGISAFTPIPVARSSLHLPQLDNGRNLHPAIHANQPQSLYSSLSIPPSSPPPPPAPTNASLPLMQSSPLRQYSNGSSVRPVPKFAAFQSSRSSSRGASPAKSTPIQAYLQQLEDNVILRQIDADAQKDYEELEKQKTFLASLSNYRMTL